MTMTPMERAAHRVAKSKIDAAALAVAKWVREETAKYGDDAADVLAEVRKMLRPAKASAQ